MESADLSLQLYQLYHSFMGVFNFFKLYKWCQTGQSISWKKENAQITWPLLLETGPTCLPLFSLFIGFVNSVDKMSNK